MNIGWIYPHRVRCGIAGYARDYADVLNGHVSIIDIDPQWWFSDRNRFRRSIAGCDIVHIQYDTAVFMNNRRDFFGAMTRSIAVPIVVSLHEVYEEDPSVYPRSRLHGAFPLLQLRRLVWDARHPVQRAYTRHRARAFFADVLLVHHQYHRELLTGAGCASLPIRVIALPVKQYAGKRNTDPFGRGTLNLGAFGFINPLFDYDLLFDSLRLINRQWTFTWIGGIRTEQHLPLLDDLHRRIADEQWSDRFSISGWVTDDELPIRLNELHIAFALFTNRSSSASLARLFGTGKTVIATDIPLTRELFVANDAAGSPPPLLLTDSTPRAVADAVERLCSDTALQATLRRGLDAYGTSRSFETMTRQLLDVYRELTGR
jgi:glycosyltransferase involved in cell wall biosynthesis